MNLLQRIKRVFVPEEPTIPTEVFLEQQVQHKIIQLPTKPPGRVIKVTKHPEYTPGAHVIRHGRVVRVMPRQLKQIKEAQERIVED